MNDVFQYEHDSHQFTRTNEGLDVEERGSDGSYRRWNMKHYLRVKQAREQLGLRKMPAVAEIAHPLTGKELVEVATGKRYRVERVICDWWTGSRLKAMLSVDGQYGKSHADVFIDALDCRIPSVIEQANAFKVRFGLD